MTLAHYGGLHELALFAIPAVAIVVVLRWAERRARTREDATESADAPGAGQES